MAKAKTIYECQECSHQTVNWKGKCPQCNQWDTFQETVRSSDETDPPSSSITPGDSTSQLLTEVDESDRQRYTVGMDEIDQLLGGGLVQGSATMIGGDPGIGKSTLLLQLCNALGSERNPSFYISAEESNEQMALRGRRLDVQEKHIELFNESSLRPIIQTLKNKDNPPAVVVVDSIQMLSKQGISSSPGSVKQVRECTNELVSFAKKSGIPIFLVGHVTKEGSIAGPKTMEHMVDTVLYFDGESYQGVRMLRSVKNRFGSTHSVALLEMTERGLVQVDNPSQYFLEEHESDVSGCVYCPTRVGNRTLMIEIQALTSYTSFGHPVRRCTGLKKNRLNMIIAVLKKRAGYNLENQDIYVNVAGGVDIQETASDLPVALAIASSFRDRPLPAYTAAAGEIGLAGEIRPVPHIRNRVKESGRIDFQRLFIPGDHDDLPSQDDLKIHTVKSLYQALEQCN